MFSRASLAVSPDTLSSLLLYLRTHRRLDELDEIADQAVLAWLDKAKADGFRHRAATVHGYRWKNLFLPDGTRLRSDNYSECRYAVVDGDVVIFNGQAVSPNRFNTLAPGMVRNAWRDIYLLFPGERKWKRAIDCRRELAAAAPKPFPQPPSPAALPSMQPWSGNERRQGYRRSEDLLLD
ncbi:hypothetical protein [Pseudoduganella violaceinigra]|uniref:hypothetical protein n=1 Tax=Pseudoduganella violaceinigra TaxID=246602 RepID=UPI0004141A49|nr:hypothetical protein [Pseudoduganella violaceinigra]